VFDSFLLAIPFGCARPALLQTCPLLSPVTCPPFQSVCQTPFFPLFPTRQCRRGCGSLKVPPTLLVSVTVLCPKSRSILSRTGVLPPPFTFVEELHAEPWSSSSLHSRLRFLALSPCLNLPASYLTSLISALLLQRDLPVERLCVLDKDTFLGVLGRVAAYFPPLTSQDYPYASAVFRRTVLRLPP